MDTDGVGQDRGLIKSHGRNVSWFYEQRRFDNTKRNSRMPTDLRKPRESAPSDLGIPNPRNKEPALF